MMPTFVKCLAVEEFVTAIEFDSNYCSMKNSTRGFTSQKKELSLPDLTSKKVHTNRSSNTPCWGDKTQRTFTHTDSNKLSAQDDHD
jgi:hypothetical protein